MSKLKFSVCYCSGEEPEYPAEELNAHSPHTKGWQSPQFCDYPQELGLTLAAPAWITQVQILSHQNKIATQIELFVGDGDNYESAHFKRLGYLSLNGNVESNYQARELKSVYVNAPGQFLRILVHKCYINEHNFFNQVGIIGVNLLGENLRNLAPGAPDAPLAPYGAGCRAIPAYAQGNAEKNVTQGRSIRTDLNDLSFDMNFDPETAQRIRDIASAKDRAVRVEDYDTAKLLKEAETQLKSLGRELAQLEAAKREAVEDEDYDRAKMIKVEADTLRLQIVAHPNPELGLIFNHGNTKEPVRDSSGVALGNQHSQEKPVIQAQAPSAGETRKEVNKAANFLRVDERSFLRHDDSEGGNLRVLSPVERSGEGPGTLAERGSDDMGGSQASPLETKPRVSRSSEGLRSHLPRQELADIGSAEAWEQERGAEEDGETTGGTEFPPGEHPLEGVPNLANLPAPETLSAKVDLSEVQGLTSLFGDYLTRCLYSKVWSLREAAILKVKLSLSELEKDPGINSSLGDICQVLRVGCEDKIAQVFISTLDLLNEALRSIGRCKDVRHNQIVAALEPTAVTLLNKLGDGQARLRDRAMNGLVAVAHCRMVGPPFVSHLVLKPFIKKQLSAWRPITARLTLLRQLVHEFGLESGSGLAASNIMRFVQSCNGFSHSNGDVRDAARELTVELQALVGSEIEPYLAGLRPKQLDEYHEAFRQSGNTTRGHTNSSRGSGTRPTPRRGSHTDGRERGGGTPATARGSEGRSKAPRTQTRSRSPGRENKHPDDTTLTPACGGIRHAMDEEDRDLQDVLCTCQFCGKYDPSFNADNLDIHYWQQCPMLMSCRECGQVIEISDITEHLLDECTNRDDYTECDISLMAIRTVDLDKWQRSKICKPPGKGGPRSTCPLCFTDVGRQDDDELWRAHLLEACPRNPRRG